MAPLARAMSELDVDGARSRGSCYRGLVDAMSSSGGAAALRPPPERLDG